MYTHSTYLMSSFCMCIGIVILNMCRPSHFYPCRVRSFKIPLLLQTTSAFQQHLCCTKEAKWIESVINKRTYAGRSSLWLLMKHKCSAQQKTALSYSEELFSIAGLLEDTEYSDLYSTWCEFNVAEKWRVDLSERAKERERLSSMSVAK